MYMFDHNYELFQHNVCVRNRVGGCAMRRAQKIKAAALSSPLQFLVACFASVSEPAVRSRTGRYLNRSRNHGAHTAAVAGHQRFTSLHSTMASERRGAS